MKTLKQIKADLEDQGRSRESGFHGKVPGRPTFEETYIKLTGAVLFVMVLQHFHNLTLYILKKLDLT